MDCDIKKLKATVELTYPAYPAWYPEGETIEVNASCDAALFTRRPEEFLKIWKSLVKNGGGTAKITVKPFDEEVENG